MTIAAGADALTLQAFSSGFSAALETAERAPWTCRCSDLIRADSSSLSARMAAPEAVAQAVRAALAATQAATPAAIAQRARLRLSPGASSTRDHRTTAPPAASGLAGATTRSTLKPAAATSSRAASTTAPRGDRHGNVEGGAVIAALLHGKAVDGLIRLPWREALDLVAHDPGHELARLARHAEPLAQDLVAGKLEDDRAVARRLEHGVRRLRSGRRGAEHLVPGRGVAPEDEAVAVACHDEHAPGAPPLVQSDGEGGQDRKPSLEYGADTHRFASAFRGDPPRPDFSGFQARIR